MCRIPAASLSCVCTYTYRVRDTVIDVEYPLIESQLKAIDEQLERAITELNWTSDGRDGRRMSLSL